MGSLTEDQLRKIGNFDADTYTALKADLEAGEAIDVVSAPGALSLTRIRSELQVTGSDALTLAAPTYANQRKIITCTLAASIPLGTLTITSPDDTTGFVCPAAHVFNAVGQELELVATAALKWRCVRKKRAGILAGIVGGTTVLTGLNMNSVYAMAIDGTDAGTGAGGLPNGSAVGERCSIVVESIAGIPAGSLTGAYLGVGGTAYTVAGAFGVAAATTTPGDVLVGVWNGSAWQVEWMSGVTLS